MVYILLHLSAIIAIHLSASCHCPPIVVARSLVCGNQPSVEQIAYALHQIKSCHPLLKAHIEKKDGCLFFVSSQQDCDREIALEVKKSKIDCEEHMDTKFNCAEGGFLRIIISNAVHNNG